MPIKKIENKDNILLTALGYRREGKTLPEIRELIKSKYNQTVSQSFMQKNLSKYKGCENISDLRARDAEKVKTKEKINWSNETKSMGNQVIIGLIDNIQEIVYQSSPKISTTDEISLNELIALKIELEEYLKSIFRKCLTPINKENK